MSKQPKKFRGKAETVKLPRHFITGGVCNGYFVNDRNNEAEPVKFVNMWDAIHERDKLNGE